jgi:hypothetical protein
MAEDVQDEMEAPPQQGAEDEQGSDVNSKVPCSKLKPAERFVRLKQWVQQDARALHDWRMQASLDFAFEAGDQWLADDRAYLSQNNRPIITFNRTKATISAVTGMEVNNRQEVRYIPRTEEDAGINELYTEAARWVRDSCDAEDEESDMFGDDCICGIGFTDTRVSYDDDPDGMILVERLDPLQMGWDFAAIRKNLADARRVWHGPNVDIALARQHFPDATDAELDAKWITQNWLTDSEEPIDRNKSRHYWAGNAQPKDRREVTIVRIQWYEEEPYYRVANPTTGEIEELDEEAYSKVKARFEKSKKPLVGVKQKRKRFYQSFLGAKELEFGEAPSQKDFTMQAVTGYRDRNQRQWYGLVRLMRDPQQWANKFFSTIQHIISTSGKGIMAEAGAFADPKKAEAEWARPDSIALMEDGAISGNRVAPKPGQQLPPGLPQMLEFVVSSIRDVTGINLEVLGMADRDQAASLEAQRRQAAVTILATFFDGLRRYRKRQGRLLLDMIRTYISDGRLIRIVGDEGEKYIPLVKSEAVVEYDVIVDEAATSPNQKEATWAIITQLMPTLTELGLPLPVWKQILKVSPLPNSATEKIIAALEEQAKQPKPPSPEEQKMQLEKQKAEMAMQAQQQDIAARAQESQINLQAQQQKNAMDAQKAQQEAEQERQKFALEVAKMVLELQMKQQTAALDVQTAQIQAGQQREMGQMKVEQAREMGSMQVDQAKQMGAIKAKQAAKPKPEARGK